MGSTQRYNIDMSLGSCPVGPVPFDSYYYSTMYKDCKDLFYIFLRVESLFFLYNGRKLIDFRL